jgi:hypothetical protein
MSKKSIALLAFGLLAASCRSGQHEANSSNHKDPLQPQVTPTAQITPTPTALATAILVETADHNKSLAVFYIADESIYPTEELATFHDITERTLNHIDTEFTLRDLIDSRGYKRIPFVITDKSIEGNDNIMAIVQPHSGQLSIIIHERVIQMSEVDQFEVVAHELAHFIKYLHLFPNSNRSQVAEELTQLRDIERWESYRFYGEELIATVAGYSAALQLGSTPEDVYSSHLYQLYAKQLAETDFSFRDGYNTAIPFIRYLIETESQFKLDGIYTEILGIATDYHSGKTYLMEENLVRALNALQDEKVTLKNLHEIYAAGTALVVSDILQDRYRQVDKNILLSKKPQIQGEGYIYNNSSAGPFIVRNGYGIVKDAASRQDRILSSNNGSIFYVINPTTGEIQATSQYTLAPGEEIFLVLEPSSEYGVNIHVSDK